MQATGKGQMGWHPKVYPMKNPDRRFHIFLTCANKAKSAGTGIAEQGREGLG